MGHGSRHNMNSSGHHYMSDNFILQYSELCEGLLSFVVSQDQIFYLLISMEEK